MNRIQNIVIGALANVAAKEIGSNYKTSDKTVTDRTIQLASHAALGCASASAAGGDCASGAVAGVVGELAAEYAKDSLYPDQNVASLTHQQKTNIKELAGLAGGFSAIFTGNLAGLDDSEVAENIFSGQRIGKNAAANNALFYRAGTFSDPNETEKDFIQAMEESTGQKVIIMPNELKNNDSSRQELAQQLADAIKNYELQPNEPIILVGHSHGGNVIKIATNLDLGHKQIDSVIFLGTPHRQDYKISYDNFTDDAKLINVYDKGDFVQKLGGNPILFGKRQIDGFNNISIIQGNEVNYWDWKSGIKYGFINSIGPLDSHSNLDTKSVWNKYINPIFNKYE